jgi:chaperonin GroEL (HSP60 family)
MAHKRILFREAAREKVLRGAAQLVDAVPITLGPRSKSVLIQRSWGPLLVCNDGVTIALENAASIAGLLLSSEATKTVRPEPKRRREELDHDIPL